MASAAATKRKSINIAAEDEDADFAQGKVEAEQQPKPAAKKPKAKAAAREFPFELSEKRRATVRTFAGKVLIDIREYYTDAASGEDKPGKKGIALSPEQWEALKAVASEIDEAVAELS